MKKTEMVKEEEDPASQISISTTSNTTTGVSSPRHRQTQTHCNVESESESPTQTFLSRHRCCFSFPCFGSPHQTARNSVRLGVPTTPSSFPSRSFWDKIQTAENEEKWWTQPIKAFKKIREWSEIVAGPRWKTFIRRFNRNGYQKQGYSNNHSSSVSGKTFQYDALSYALNFDEGVRGREHDEFDEEEFGYYPDFTSRFVTVNNNNNNNNSQKSAAVLWDLSHNSKRIAPAD